MPTRRLLLLSNSRNAGMDYLAHADDAIRQFLGDVKTVAFVPYAGVTISYDEYAARVQERFASIGYTVRSVHAASDPVDVLTSSDAVAVGGGNTFHLLRALYETRLIEAIRAAVAGGMPYVGWSAGSNVACPTICTTNDMPIVQPPSFEALGLVPFQINPHYTDVHPPGHQGETRAMRLQEYITANPTATVAALPEGTWIHVADDMAHLHGGIPMRLMRHGNPTTTHDPESDVSFLLK